MKFGLVLTPAYWPLVSNNFRFSRSLESDADDHLIKLEIRQGPELANWQLQTIDIW